MTPLLPGATFSHYRIIEQLGQGGQATAYKAIDTRLDRSVVIKILLPVAKQPRVFEVGR